jgi:hypothetical protein
VVIFFHLAKNQRKKGQGGRAKKTMHKGFFLKKWPKFAKFQKKQFKISMSNIGFRR